MLIDDSYTYVKKNKNVSVIVFFLLFQSVNGGLVMVSFDSAHLSCGDKASMYDVIGTPASNSI